MKKWLVTAAILLVTIGVVVYVVVAPSEEQKIRKVVQRLARTVEPHPSANPILEFARIKSEFDELLTERVEVAIPELCDIPSARKDLAQAAVQAGSRFGVADIELIDIVIKVDDAKLRADVDTTASFRRSTSALSREERRVHFSLRNDDRWRVSSINVSAASPR